MNQIIINLIKNNLVFLLTVTLIFISFWSKIISEWLALLLVFFAGIPHGAFDLRLAKIKWGNNSQVNLINSPLRVITIYFLTGLLMSSLCLILPTFGLLAFIFVSVIHFGESECRVLGNYWGYLIGIVSILSPVAFHPFEAMDYLSFFIPEAQFILLFPILYKINILILTLILARILYLYLIYKLQSQTSKLNQKFYLEFLSCILSWIILPPLAGFSVWFIGRHTKQHFLDCIELFSAPENQEEKKYWVNNFLNSDFIILSVVAMLLILPLGFKFDLFNIKEFFAASIVLIAGLTLPHVLVTLGIKKD